MKYETIIIKSPADYPKTEGEYFCCRNGFKSVQRLIPDDGQKSYMREIDWYLQPIEPVEAKKQEGAYYCSVCHKNVVDAENGFDTCSDCLTKI